MIEIKDIMQNLEASARKEASLTDWRPILANECQVYVCGESYLAKKFDQINYRFCGEREAAGILRDNLYALLRFKYFTTASEENDERIQKIISSFMINLKTTLKKVTLDPSSDGDVVKLLPDYCCAFKNGVFNFKTNKWEFMYEIKDITKLSNRLYEYPRQYVILWYLNFDFEPLPLNIMTIDLQALIKVFKKITLQNRNYCFELMYNMSHDMTDMFSEAKFNHLCEILGFSMLQSFVQAFVMLVGSGGNGKNSLFDGCFTSKLVPLSVSESLDDIATDKFISGVLENRHLNIFLESSNQSNSIGYKESKPLKQITGSTNQNIEHKGIDAYPGYLNVRHIFAANDQDAIKFSDTTQGFRRRINVFETWYTWDAKKRFLTKGDYYDTSFSEDLSELKSDITNTIAYVYFAMFGIKSATNNFSKTFAFTRNDWNLRYSDIDISLKEKLEKISISDIVEFIRRSKTNYEDCKQLFYDMNKIKLQNSPSMSAFGCNSYDKMLSLFEDDEKFVAYFSEYDAFISVRLLQAICGDFVSTATAFTQSLKKLYSISSFQMLAANKPYAKCTFVNNRLKIIR